MAGSSYSNDGDVSGNHGSSDYWIVKLDSAGTLEWQKSLGGTSSDQAYSIQQTTDGRFVVAGESYSNDGDVSGNHGSTDYWIVKLDSSGNIEWQKSLGGTSGDEAYFIQQTTDGGIVVAGRSWSNDGDVSGNHGSADYWIVKLDSTGTIEWQKSLGGTSGDRAYSIQQTTDGGFVVAGSSESNDGDVSGNHGNYDYWIVKLDVSGNIEWQKSLGGTDYDHAYAIQQTSDGGLAVAGNSNSTDGDVSGNHGSADYWIVKLDASGNLEWQKSLGGTDYDDAWSIQQTSDGGFAVAGHSYSNDGDVSGNHGGSDYWIVKLQPTFTNSGESEESDGGFTVFPNPTDGVIVIELELSDELTADATIEMINLLGQVMQSQKATIVKGRLQEEIQFSDAEAEGMYLVKVIIKDKVFTAQIDLQK